MPAIRINDVSYFYRRQGAGPPLVLLHGFTGSSLSWATLAETLASQYDIISIDLLGHGKSECPQQPVRYSIQHAASDVLAIVERLDLQTISLLGYSMGGRLALYLAQQYPEIIKTLLLESASPGIAGVHERKLRRQWDYDLADSIEREGVDGFIDQWERLPLFASQSAVPRRRQTNLRKQRLQNSALGLANSLRGMGTGSQPSLWNGLAANSRPTLLLCGGIDTKYVQINAEMAGLMPRAELGLMAGAGHNTHFEQPDEFSEVVSDFLKEAG